MRQLSFSLAFAMPAWLFAQAPQAFDFQGVARDASGAVLSDQAIGLLVSIVTDNPNGTVVYRESHAPTTSPFGLFTVAVGQGTPLLGTLAGVDWGGGPKYIRLGMDPNGGNAYQDLGATQLLSVPYALHAGTGGGGGGTLDDAYDSGGPGLGRTINADAGAVQIINAGTNPTGLQVNTDVPNSTAVRADHTGVGVSVRAASLNPANTFAAMQATTNSSDANNSAIIGNNEGAGYAIAGQIPGSASGSAAVYGSNLRTNGGSGVTGIGFNGVVGQAQNGNGYGVYGLNANPAGGVVLGIGTYGLGFHGVYGQTTDAGQGWAGYFTADVGVEGTGFALGGWVNASDARLKRDIRPIEGALDKVRLLEGRHYQLQTRSKGFDGEVVTNSRPQYGLIAQDVAGLFPEMVGERALFSGLGDDTVYKTVDYIQLVPVLIEAIKELSSEVEELRRELDSRR